MGQRSSCLGEKMTSGAIPRIPDFLICVSMIGVGIFFCWHWSCKATLTPGWKGFVVTNAELGFQQCPWKGFGSAPASRCFHFHDRSKPNGRFFVRAIDVAAVDESCQSIHLLSWLPFPRTKNVRPEFLSSMCNTVF